MGLLFFSFCYARVIWGYMGIMEMKMETTTMGYLGFRLRGFFYPVTAASNSAVPCEFRSPNS